MANKMANNSPFQTFKSLPKEGDIPLRIVALEKNLEILEKKINFIGQMVQANAQATNNAVRNIQLNHQVLLQVLLKKDAVTMPELEERFKEIVASMMQSEDAKGEAAEQEKAEGTNGADQGTDAGSEAGRSDSNPEGISGESRNDLSEEPGTDGKDRNIH